MSTRTARLGLGLLLAAGSAIAGEGRPRLVIDEPVHDFGAVEQGERVEHTFRLGNRGDADLRVEHVKSSCGCTVAVAPATDISPGEVGQVSVSLETVRVAGRTTKTVTVYTNDPETPVAGLTLTGQVLTDLAISPNPVYLGRLHRGEPGGREVLITPGRAGTSYVVTGVEHSNPALRATLEPRSDGPGQRLLIEVDPGAPLGRLSEQLRLRTTSPRTPEMTLGVLGSVEGDVSVLPPQVTFGITRADESPERELVIRSRGARPLAVTKVSVPEDIVTYRLEATREGVEYQLTLRLRHGLPPGKVEGAIEILTDHPDEDRLVVPLYAIIRGRRRG
jgi:hypothetical protein